MTNTDILLEDLEDVLDDATSMPMTKKCLVDVEKIKTIIEDIRLNTPHETKQAKAIIDSRNTILDDAQKDAQAIIAEAEAQARELVARDQITQTAQAQAAQAREEGDISIREALARASEILGTATAQANEMLAAAQKNKKDSVNAVNNYAEDTLLAIDDALYKALQDVRGIRQNLMRNVGGNQ